MGSKLKTKCRSPLPWFGSDASVAMDLAGMLDGCKHVTIPFAGGMSILPQLKATHVVANDLHHHAMNFYSVLNGVEGKRLAERCRKTLSHPAELDIAAGILDTIESGFVERAWAFWAQCWIGRKGKGGTKHQGGMPSVRRTPSGGSNASRLKSAAADLEAWAEEFRRCEFTCEDFRECLEKVADRDDCGIYVDAPWVGAGRNYLHPFEEGDHNDLFSQLCRFEKTKVVVRYGDDPLIWSLYQDFNIHEATSRTQSNSKIGELWITNK